jgi:acyl carrier protein
MMTDKSVLAGLNAIFADVFMRDDIVLRPEMTMADIGGWDSFKQIEIIMEAEDRFALKFTSRELDDLPNVGALVTLIERKTIER